jgi:putative transposase
VKNGRARLIEFNGEEDHIYLLFQYYPQMDLSNFVNNIKSVASRRLRSEFPERVNEFYRSYVLWSSSYFIASCGVVTISTLRKYIENQDAPEA